MAENKFGGNCDLCNVWVYPGEGMRRKPGFKKRDKWTVRHIECHDKQREANVAKEKAKERVN